MKIEHLAVEYNKSNDVKFTMNTPHSHTCYELYFLSSGQRKYFIHDQTYLINAGSIVLIPPYVIHKAINSNNPYHERYLLYIDEKQLKGLLSHLDKMNWFEPFDVDHPVIRLEAVEQIVMTKKMDELIRLKKECSQKGKNIYLLKVLELLWTIGELEDCPSIQGMTELGEANSEKDRRILELVRYINTHYMEALTLKSLSQRFYISSYYLSRTFKEVTGFGFNDYINQVRVLEAEKLLLNTKGTIIDIALKVGYESSTNFGRVFRKYKGMTARSYREKYSLKLE